MGKLIELPKNPKVDGGKFFKRSEDIPRMKVVKVNLVGLQSIVGCKVIKVYDC